MAQTASRSTPANAATQGGVAPVSSYRRRVQPQPRAVDTTPEQAPNPTDVAKQLLATFVRLNERKNELAREEKAAKEALDTHMLNFKITSVREVVDGVTKEAAEKSKTEVVIDVKKLAKLVSPESFFKIVKATQTAVKDEAGAMVLKQVKSEIPNGTEIKVSTVKNTH